MKRELVDDADHVDISQVCPEPRSPKWTTPLPFEPRATREIDQSALQLRAPLDHRAEQQLVIHARNTSRTPVCHVESSYLAANGMRQPHLRIRVSAILFWHLCICKSQMHVYPHWAHARAVDPDMRGAFRLMTRVYNGMLASELPGVEWNKSGYSNPNGSCVELAMLPGGETAIRNSRDPSGPALVCTREQMAALLDGAKAGQFDYLACGS